MSALEDFQPGDRFLENFRIEGVLGRGGMGEVYLATDVWMEREVAVKLIQRKYADLPDFVERFRRETKALAKLEHRNIVRVYSAGRAPDGRLYMIMERLHGLSLRKIIETARRLDLVSAIHYGIQIAEGVSIAHAKGILHRDIKPENILVGPGGHVWVLDFGLAKSTASTVHTDERKEMGTTRYMSPEQIHGQRADERADLYAIGIVLYEMLAGRHPYPSVDDDADIGKTEILAAHIFARPTPLVEIIPDCPEPVWELVARCLAKAREERHPNAEALATDLRAALRVSAPPDHPIAQRVAREQAEASRRKAIEARGQAPSLGPTQAVGRVELAQAPTRAVSTEPLRGDFIPVDPAPSRSQLGQGHTVKIVPWAGATAPSPPAGGWQPAPLERTAPLPPSAQPAPPVAPVATAPLPASGLAMPPAMRASPSPVFGRAPMPSSPEGPRLPMPSSPEAPPAYSFTTQSRGRTPQEPSGAWSPAAKAPAKSDPVLAPPLPALQPMQTLRGSMAVLILAGVGVAAAVAGLVFFVWFQQRPAAPSAAVPPVVVATAPAAAVDEPSPPTEGAAGEAEASAAPAASAALPEAPVASAALPEAPAASAALPVAPVASAVLPVAPVGMPPRPAIGASKLPSPTPSPRLAAAKPTAAPSASAAAPAPRARVGRLWLDADPVPSAAATAVAPAKPGSTRLTPVPPFEKARGVKR
jgi:serine/threonine protein kinase